MNHDSKRPVTIEDLLRLKRAERPPAEFWEGFDRELRAKQLAALVEKSPWWRSLPRVLAGASRFYLPAGAAAALAVTFLATRDYSAPVPVGEAPVAVALASSASATVSSSMSEQAVAAPLQGGVGAATQLVAAISEVPADETPAVVPAETTEVSPARERGVSHLISLLEEPAREISPSAAYIAANLAAAGAEDAPLSRNLLVPARGFESRAMPARTQMVDPLAQMATPAAKSRARFATAMVASFAGEVASRSNTANAARRIGERVYEDDAVRRVGATGNSVAWKF